MYYYLPVRRVPFRENLPVLLLPDLFHKFIDLSLVPASDSSLIEMLEYCGS